MRPSIIQFRALFVVFLFSTYFLSAQNYDESKVGNLLIPDVLTTVQNEKIKNKKQWEQQQKPEILSLFETQVYGRMPKDFDKIEFEVKNENKQAMEGKAHLKEVAVKITRNQKSVVINLVMFTPAQAAGPVPVFLLINNRPARNTAPERDTLSGFWPAEQVIAAGYGIAAFQVNDAAPDHKTTFRNGVLDLYPEALSQPDGMKAIGSWAWAASRVLDYFEKDKQVEAKKVAIVGHSRGGKASLWTAAQDQRFAMCFSNNSGNTGAALSKRNFGETVKIINTAFPHWFSDNYKQYNDNESALPVDQHMLLALVAPRPLYVTSASEDRWADPTGTYMALKLTEPVYELYKKTSSLPANQPPLNTPVIQSPTGYHIREGIHNLTEYDWAQYVRFADYQWKKNKN